MQALKQLIIHLLRDTANKIDAGTCELNATEATELNELLVQISIDKGGNYKQYYYPAASECYAYQPSVKEGEVLLDKFKAHHWWLPSEGELARMYYYHSHGYDTTKDDTKAIFAQASDSGTLKKFGTSVFWPSTEANKDYACYVNFSNGDCYTYEPGRIIAFHGEKDKDNSVRPVCAF